MPKKKNFARQQTDMRMSRSRITAHVPLKQIPGLERYLRDREKARRQKETRDLAESLDFLDWLKKQKSLSFGADVSWKAPVYRLMYGGAPPLSIMGSFGAGGRFNLGMAQMSAHFPNLKPQACLYAASTLECCFAEAQPPYGKPQEYQLVPHCSFMLWDMQKVLRHYGDPVLERRILDSPLDAIWSHQKVPMTSQLLAVGLRRIGGDGIIMPSTKRMNDSNIAFFFDSEISCEKAFHSNLLPD